MNSLLTALMQQMLKQAEKEMKTQPEVTCQFLCQDEGGKIEVEKFGMPPREKQGLFTTLIRSYFQSKGYRRYVFMSEVWAVEYNPETAHIPPSKHNSRKEFLQIHGRDVDGSSILYIFPIRRDSKNRRTLGERIDIDDATGPLTNFLEAA